MTRTRSSFLASAVLVALAFAGCGDNAEAPGPDELLVSPTTIALRVGETTDVTATFQKHGAELAGGHASWTSSDPTHAKVQGSGAHATITGVGAGEATITATSGELSATIAVSVSPALIAQIAITPAAPSLAAGTDATLHVIATFSDATTADVTDSVAWTSVAPAIATVAGSTLSGVAKGTTTITAMYLGKFSSTEVFVSDAVVRSIDVAPAAPTVVLGGTQQFTATGHFSDATVRDITTAVTWMSSATASATISNTAATRGLATTVGVGPTTISATLGGVTGMTTLTVEPVALVSIAITPAGDLPLGTSQQQTATGTFNNGALMDLSASVAWASSAPAMATISSGGLVSAVALGPTTITATSGPITGTAVVHVVLVGIGAP